MSLLTISISNQKMYLKQALSNFEGTLIVVSHDRDFLQDLTNKVYEFKNHKLREYLGDINYYLEQHNLEDLRALEKKEKINRPKKKINSDFKDKKHTEKEFKKLKNSLASVEQKITIKEEAVKKLELQIQYNNFEISQSDFFNNYKSAKVELEKLMTQWERLQEKIDLLSS